MNETNADPLGLNINLREVDTSRPILAPGRYLFDITEADVVPNAQDPTKRNLRIQLALSGEHGEGVPANQEGKSVSPGYPLRRYLPLQQSDNPKAPPFDEELARLVDAAFQIEDPDDRPEAFPPPSDLIGRTVCCTVRVKEDPTYGLQNDIGAMLNRDAYAG